MYDLFTRKYVLHIGHCLLSLKKDMILFVRVVSLSEKDLFLISRLGYANIYTLMYDHFFTIPISTTFSVSASSITEITTIFHQRYIADSLSLDLINYVSA